MIIDQNDLAQLLTEVESFTGHRIATAAERPEHPIQPQLFKELTREASDLGILSLPTDGAGFGVWEHRDDANSMAFNIGALKLVGHANPGVAFAWHRTALASVLADSVGFSLSSDSAARTTIAPTGHYGLARNSLARWFKTRNLNGEDASLLKDWLDHRQHATPIVAPADWQTLLWPVWNDHTVEWQLVERDNLDVISCARQHGFDELAACLVKDKNTSPKIKTLDPDVSRRIYDRVLKMDMIGLLSIGLGALKRGQAMACGYASIRRQGGKLISAHPAVQQLLADIEVAKLQAEITLAAFALPIDEIDLGAVVATHAGTHALLCHAANQIVQLHGGIGYMRDTGAEKIVRDQNMLKLQSGGVRDAQLFVAAWAGEPA